MNIVTNRYSLFFLILCNNYIAFLGQYSTNSQSVQFKLRLQIAGVYDAANLKYCGCLFEEIFLRVSAILHCYYFYDISFPDIITVLCYLCLRTSFGCSYKFLYKVEFAHNKYISS